MKVNLQWCILLFMLLLAINVSAQEKTITGTVIGDDGQPLTGVSVLAVGVSNVGTTTNLDGQYTLRVPAGVNQLEFKYLGFISQIIPITSEQLNVNLSSDSQELVDVVVTALGIEREAKSLTYSAQVVKGSSMDAARETNVINSLQGKVSGVVISKSATGPGGSSRVVLRGNRSITGDNQPLYVIDGVPMNSGSRASGGGSFGGRDGGGGISMINPDNIETMTVLKGASAAALYGSAGQNGAIVITTKSGKAGKPTVEFNGGMTFDTAMELPKLQTQYGQGDGNVYSPNSEHSWGEKLDGHEVTLWNGSKVPYVAHPNNMKEFFRTANTINNSITVSGGNEKMRTFFSFGNVVAQGILRNNDMVRNNVDFKLDNNIGEKLSLTTKISYINQKTDNMPSTGEAGHAVQSMYRTPVSIPTAEMKKFNYFNEDGREYQSYWKPGSSILGNPYWALEREVFLERKDRVLGLFQVKYDFTDWLNLQVRGSIDKTLEDTEDMRYRDTYLWSIGSNYLTANYMRQSTNLDALLSLNRTLSEKFKLVAFAGASMQQGKGYTLTIDANGLNKQNYFDMVNAKAPLPDNSHTLSPQVQSIYGSGTVGYNDYLFLDVTARNDWSSALPRENWSYFYPSVGLTGIISEMITLPEWITYGKLRASMAYSGNGGGAYRDRNYYGVARGGSITTPATRSLPTYKPEITRAFEVGADWRFFNHRVGFDITYYTTDTKNQLITLATPAASLYSGQYINVGLVNNKGVEGTLDVTPVRTDDFSWNAAINYSKNINKIIELADYLKRAILVDDRQVLEVVDEGKSYGDMYGIGWQRDNQGRPLVTETGSPMLTQGKDVYLGNYNPNYNLGFNNSLSYKNLSLDFLLDYRNGGTVIAGTQALLDFDGHSEASLRGREDGIVLDAYTVDGQKNTKSIPAQTYFGAIGEKYPASEFYAYPGTNLRLREVVLGYSFSSNILGANGFIRGAKISFVGRNLFFLYKPAPFDPEVVTGTGNYQGIEYNSLPSTRNIGLNLKLTF